jgi:hypothetical protein
MSIYISLNLYPHKGSKDFLNITPRYPHCTKMWVVSFVMISPLQSTAGHKPLQFLAISLGLRLLASSSCQPSCINRHSTWPEGVLHYVYLDAVSTPEFGYPSGKFYSRPECLLWNVSFTVSCVLHEIVVALIYGLTQYRNENVFAVKKLIKRRTNSVVCIRITSGLTPEFFTFFFKYLLLRISNKYGSVTALKHWLDQTIWPNQTIVNGLQIMPSASLVRNISWNQTSILYVNSSIKLNLSQLKNVFLKPRKRFGFLIHFMLFQSSDTFYK